MAEPRRLNVDLLNVPDALLTIDGADYLIRGSALFGEHMLRLVDIEMGLLAAEGEAEAVLAAEGSAVITELVRLQTPKAPDLDLNTVQVLAIFAHIVGADSITASLVEALQGGLQGLDEEALATLLKESDKDGAAAPLAPAKRSSGASSRSGKRTTGRRSGGRPAAGARAGSTSQRKRSSS